MNLDDIFNNSFLNDFNQKEKRKIQSSKEDRIITEEKLKKLNIVKEFLDKFVDLGVYVNHREKYNKNTVTLDGIEPQKFHYYFTDSSKTFAPGVSIWFDHPASVEIAIPNNEELSGVVVINVASHNDFSYLLNSKFTTYESFCESLGRFIGKCTTSVEKDPRVLQQEIEERNKLLTPTKPIIIEAQEKNERSNHHVYEKPVLKEGNATGLKKIGNLLKLKKTDDEDDE